MSDRPRTSFGLLFLILLVCRILPRWGRIQIARVVGTIFYWSSPRIRHSIQQNLMIVSKRSLSARSTLVHYAIYLVDYMTFPSLTRETLDALVPDYSGADHFLQARQKGKGSIIVTPHLGNWELGGIWLSQRNYPVRVVSLVDEDSRTQDFRNQMREQHGIKLLEYDPNSSSLDSMKNLLDALKKNESVAMLTDRPVAERTVNVPFFGKSRPFPIGPFLLSWLSQATVIPSYCILQSDKTYKLVIDAPIEMDRSLDRNESIRKGVEMMAHRYETYIRANPDQWYNFYPYFA